MVDNRVPQGITQSLTHPQPGMFVTKTMTCPQLVPPLWRIHILIELVIQMAFHALLFQPANGTARFAARLQ